MSSYYDDEDFAEEYRRRDEEAIDWAISERESAADMRLPGEAFCASCPDHEGCSQGVPCDVARRATLVVQRAAATKTTMKGQKDGDDTGTSPPSEGLHARSLGEDQ